MNFRVYFIDTHGEVLGNDWRWSCIS